MKPNDAAKMVRDLSEKLLDMNPDPIPRFLILRDLLGFDSDSMAYRKAETGLLDSRWIKTLHESQWSDGTWGRFHTQNTKVKQPIPTTEMAVSLAVGSGLDKRSALLEKTTQFLVDHIRGTAKWRDFPEKQDNPAAWFVITPYISAAVLSLVDADYPEIATFR